MTSTSSRAENASASNTDVAGEDLLAQDGNTASLGQETAAQTPPTIAGRYRLLRRMAEGGSGQVYEARDTTTLRRCALKLLSKVGANPGFGRRFAIEARTTAQLESDHIVQVIDAGIDEYLRFPYIAMELLRGEDLRDTLKRLGHLAPDVAVRLARQAATGLSRAHQLGVVHRDVKPANLFLAERDAGDVCVKVLDFGIAKIKAALEFELELESGDSCTTVGPLGTPRYMSPEQLQREAQIDARTDVWSLGAVLYEMLSGKALFPEARSVAELRTAVLGSSPEALGQAAPWVSSDLIELVNRALSRDPRDRYADADEFARALAEFARDTRVSVVELRTIRSASEPAPSPHLPNTPSLRREDDRAVPTLASNDGGRPAATPARGRMRAAAFIGVALGSAIGVIALSTQLRPAPEAARAPTVEPALPADDRSPHLAATRSLRPADEVGPPEAKRLPSPATTPRRNLLVERSAAATGPVSSAKPAPAATPTPSAAEQQNAHGAAGTGRARASDTLRRPGNDFK